MGEKDIEVIEAVYPSFLKDYQSFMPYLNKENLRFLPQELRAVVAKVESLFPCEEDEAHTKVTSLIMHDFGREDFSLLRENIERAAFIRGFLG